MKTEDRSLENVNDDATRASLPLAGGYQTMT
jgi:hypothetical protein